MIRIITFCIVLLTTTLARAEFTAEEKAEILRVRSIVDNSRRLLYYAGNELWAGTNRSVDQKALDMAIAASNLETEAENCLQNLIGSLTTDVPSNRPLSETLQPAHRVASAKFYLGRIHPYRTGQLRAALNAALAAGATTSNLTLPQAAALVITRIEQAAAATNLDLATGFVSREPAWWPFLVRRASDNVGVHGHFEKATEDVSQGKGYLRNADYFAAVGLKLWVGEIPERARKGFRNMTLSSKDLLVRVTDFQLASFGVGSVAPDGFTRLFDELEDALIGGGLGVRSVAMFGLREVLYGAMATNQAAAAEYLAEAEGKMGDGWGQAVDLWSWDAVRFPCIAGFESVGCQQGRPSEPLLPQ